jgi:hypothetical protein
MKHKVQKKPLPDSFWGALHLIAKAATQGTHAFQLPEPEIAQIDRHHQPIGEWRQVTCTHICASGRRQLYPFNFYEV